MKRVLLVEGENDLILCKHILRRSGVIDSEIRIFDNTGTKYEKKTQETSVLNSLVDRNSPFKILIKVENGRDFVLSLFANVGINFLMTQRDTYFTVIFDHDRRDPEDDIKRLFSDIRSRNREIHLQEIGKSKINSDVSRRDISIKKISGHNEKFIQKFSITTFRISLEDSVDERSIENPVEERISRFAEKIRHKDFLGEL
ncbi:MAG: hypothetical protein ACYDAZ_06590 [Thermoplasmataceae archaeon]